MQRESDRFKVTFTIGGLLTENYVDFKVEKYRNFCNNCYI